MTHVPLGDIIDWIQMAGFAALLVLWWGRFFPKDREKMSPWLRNACQSNLIFGSVVTVVVLTSGIKVIKLVMLH